MSQTLFRGILVKRKHTIKPQKVPDDEVEISNAHRECKQDAGDETSVDGHNAVDEVRGEVSEGERRQDRHHQLEHQNEVVVELFH